MGLMDRLRKCCIMKKVRDKADDSEEEEPKNSEKSDESKD